VCLGPGRLFTVRRAGSWCTGRGARAGPLRVQPEVSRCPSGCAHAPSSRGVRLYKHLDSALPHRPCVRPCPTRWICTSVFEPSSPIPSSCRRAVWNTFPPFGTCLVIGIQRAGRRRPPTATGPGRGRMDRSGRGDCLVLHESRDNSHPSRWMRSTVYRTVTAVWNIGPRTRTDGPERLRRPSHPPDFQGGPNAREHGSCHVRHHPLMGATADVDRCGSV
jgi:hypothetical protein